MPLFSCFNGLRRRCALPPGKIQTLQFPLRFDGNVAVLESRFRMERGMREFSAADWHGLEAFKPAAIVAPLNSALVMAEWKLRGMLQLPELQMALVVLTSLDGGLLVEHHGDLLWRAFGVPVFEQLRDSSGIVIARECEVHDGLHIAAASALPAIACELVTAQCECGADTPRLRHLAPVRPMAASAAA